MVTLPSASSPPDPPAQPASMLAATPAVTSAAATRVMLRLFIFEPLESFDSVVESDLDRHHSTAAIIRGQGEQISFW
jgi:hypothetical protein